MIDIKFEIAPDGKTLVFTAKGHAGSEEQGKDLICASSSILAYTLAQNVKFMEEKKQLKKKPKIRLDSGDTVITCKPTKNHINAAIYMFSVIETGFALLEANFPRYVQLKTFGNADER